MARKYIMCRNILALKNYLLLFIFPVQSEHEADLQAYSVETVDILPLEGPCRGNLLATKGQRKTSRVIA